MCNLCHHSIPDRNGFMFLGWEFIGIKLSRFTSEAAAGSRNDSGVRHIRAREIGRLSLRSDRSKSSGLHASPRPLMFT